MPGKVIWDEETYIQMMYYVETGKQPPTVSKSKFERLKTRSKNLTVEDEMLYRVLEDGSRKAIIPEENTMRQHMLMVYYQNPATTAQDPVQLWRRINEVSEGFSQREIEHFLKQQRCWQMSKRKKQKNEKAVTPLYTDHKNQHWQCDFIVFSETLKWNNLGYSYIFTVIDHFSKRAWAFATKTREQTLVVENLKSLFTEFGSPEALHADNEFSGLLIQNLCEQWNVKIVHSEPYKPQSHGGVERFNRTIRTDLQRMMTIYDSKHLGRYSSLVCYKLQYKKA